MNAKSRITALKFLEKQKKHPEYAKQIGVVVIVIKKEGNDKIQCANT